MWSPAGYKHTNNNEQKFCHFEILESGTRSFSETRRDTVYAQFSTVSANEAENSVIWNGDQNVWQNEYNNG